MDGPWLNALPDGDGRRQPRAVSRCLSDYRQQVLEVHSGRQDGSFYDACVSLTALRVAAAVLGAVSFGSRLLIDFWLKPMTWGIDSAWRATGIVAAGHILGLGLPLALYLLMALRLSRPASLRVDTDRREFRIPVSPATGGMQAIAAMILAGSFVFTEPVPGTGRIRLVEGALAVSIASVAVAAAVAAGLLLVNRPHLTLDRDGLTYQRWWRRERFDWDNLAPGGPPVPVKRFPRFLTLPLTAPPMFGWAPASAELPVDRLHADAAFLARVIRHYVEHPDSRAAIGTHDELTRLTSIAARPAVATR